MTIYTHSHHIIPRHAGGTDDPDNLVELTVEDHAIAHWVRWKIYGDPRDEIAARMIRGQIDRQTAIKLVQRLPKTERWKKQMSERMTGDGNPFYGKEHTEANKRKIAEANRVPRPHLRELYKKRYAAGEHNVPVMKGKDNPKSRACIINGVRYDTVSEATKALGFKNHNTMRYRCLSDKDKWRNHRFVD